mmetsp:Transcript_14428/g.29041  ORF Transcript_14428/g.29041 Transcript_14428/m.29041 type:complete len:208 (+) Transcript_14428:665-1288(+)
MERNAESNPGQSTRRGYGTRTDSLQEDRTSVPPPPLPPQQQPPDLQPSGRLHPQEGGHPIRAASPTVSAVSSCCSSKDGPRGCGTSARWSSQPSQRGSEQRDRTQWLHPSSCPQSSPAGPRTPFVHPGMSAWSPSPGWLLVPSQETHTRRRPILSLPTRPHPVCRRCCRSFRISGLPPGSCPRSRFEEWNQGKPLLHSFEERHLRSF